MSDGEWTEFAETTNDDDGLLDEIDHIVGGDEIFHPIEDENPQPVDEDGFELEEDDELPSSFDPKYRAAFNGLAYLGHLEAEVNIPYHNFVVRTLTTGEKIKITEMLGHLEPYQGYGRAHRAAVAAAGLLLVDGQPLLVGSRKIDALSQKYQYIIDNWHDYVIESIYLKINELEGQVLEILKELGVYDDKRQVAVVEGAVTAGQIDEG